MALLHILVMTYVYEFISFLKITNVNNHVTETDRVAYMHIVWENNETRKENIAKKLLHFFNRQQNNAMSGFRPDFFFGHPPFC